MEAALIDKYYVLQKFRGKGGWTYAYIPEILPDKNAHFGWVKVRGTIDGLEIKSAHLMPMGNGRLFLPVSGQVRRKIKKSEGEQVHVVLYANNTPVEIPEELQQCLSDAPVAYQNFLSCTDGQKKAFVDWIYAAKKDETKVERIAKSIIMLEKNQKLSDKKATG